MAKRKTPATPAQLERKWANEERRRRVQFIHDLKKMNLMELFQTYTEVCVADDFDGMFSSEQRWKAETTEAYMRERLKAVE